jgi:hypothetical protein
MPLGEGYTVEEQLTGEAEVCGVQVEVFPMKKDVFEKRFSKVSPRRVYREMDLKCCMAAPMAEMGLAPGGRMRQEIYEDPYSIHDWDTDHRSRCFVHLVNSVAWWDLTGERPPSKPLSAKEYTASGYPWFDYYDADAKALEGAQALAGVKSVAAMAIEKRGHLPDNKSVTTPNIVNLRAGLKKGQVREGSF